MADLIQLKDWLQQTPQKAANSRQLWRKFFCSPAFVMNGWKRMMNHQQQHALAQLAKDAANQTPVVHLHLTAIGFFQKVASSLFHAWQRHPCPQHDKPVFIWHFHQD